MQNERTETDMSGPSFKVPAPPRRRSKGQRSDTANHTPALRSSILTESLALDYDKDIEINSEMATPDVKREAPSRPPSPCPSTRYSIVSDVVYASKIELDSRCRICKYCKKVNKIVELSESVQKPLGTDPSAVLSADDEPHQFYLNMMPTRHIVQITSVTKLPNRDKRMMRARLIPKSDDNTEQDLLLIEHKNLLDKMFQSLLSPKEESINLRAKDSI